MTSPVVMGRDARASAPSRLVCGDGPPVGLDVDTASREEREDRAAPFGLGFEARELLAVAFVRIVASMEMRSKFGFASCAPPTITAVSRSAERSNVNASRRMPSSFATICAVTCEHETSDVSAYERGLGAESCPPNADGASTRMSCDDPPGRAVCATPVPSECSVNVAIDSLGRRLIDTVVLSFSNELR